MSNTAQKPEDERNATGVQEFEKVWTPLVVVLPVCLEEVVVVCERAKGTVTREDS